MKTAVQPELPVVTVKFCAACYATILTKQDVCWRCNCQHTETMEVPITANFTLISHNTAFGNKA